MLRSFLALSLLLPSLGLGWGFDGHRKLASLMQDGLPTDSCLRAWFAARQTAALQDSACNPDRWKYPTAGAQYDPNEAPRHYLNIDYATPPASYPRDRAAAMQRFGVYFTANGLVPWRVEETYAALVADFRAKDTTKLLADAFVFSHYVSDAFSVLHDTKNSDPNGGLHARWESDMLAPAANMAGVVALATGPYLGTAGRADPRHNTFDVVLVGNGLVAELIADDLAADGGLPALYLASKDLTARRFGDAVTLLSSMLWTAWAEAGAPELPGFSATCSRAVPTEEIVLRGYPVPGGFTHPDWGNVPDAGPLDGGNAAADGGSASDGGANTGGGSATGGGPATGGGSATGGGAATGGWGEPLDAGAGNGANPVGCSCDALDGGVALLASLGLLWRSRRARTGERPQR
jgi:uncharacterized membrane protein YgcG